MAEAVAHGGDGCRTSARATGERFAASSLPDAHFKLVFPAHAHELRVDPLRESGMRFKIRAHCFQIEAPRILRKDDAMRIAHRKAGHAVSRVVDDERMIDDPIPLEQGGNARGIELGLPHIDGEQIGVLFVPAPRDEMKFFDARRRIDRKIALVDALKIIEIFGNATDGVPAHPALAAVCIEHAHFGIGNLARKNEDDAVPSDGKMPIGQLAREHCGTLGRPIKAIEIDVVVPDPVKFIESLLHILFSLRDHFKRMTASRSAPTAT